MKSSLRLIFSVFAAGLVTATAGWADLERISDHVYAYVDAKNPSPGGNSYGANVGLVVGKDSALVVDTLISAKEARRFLADIHKVTDRPVKYVVNTHSHLDHAWGNSEFVKQGSTVIAQDSALVGQAEAQQAFAHAEDFGLTPADLDGTSLVGPVISFPDRLTVDLGGIVVELAYKGPTHTKDSIIVSVPAEKVIFAGDLLFARYHPFLAEGDFANWIKVLNGLAKTTADTKIIPGHGPVSGTKDLVDMSRYIRAFDKQARVLCAHKSPSDAPAVAKVLSKRLPEQQRTELSGMIEANLRDRYLKEPVKK